jgi:hypothetical protein
MDQLIELLKQIQELAGVGIDALSGAKHGGKPEHEGGGKPPEGSPEEEKSEPPAEAKAEGDRPGYDGDAEKKPPFGR